MLPITRLAAFATLALLTGHAAAQESATPEAIAAYDKACGKCHNSGIGNFFSGAPKIGDEGWAAREKAAGSEDVLVRNVMNGKGKMPAQTGKSGLTDDEIKLATEYLLSKAPPPK